jgi:type I restriction enzyme M protein
MALTSTQESTMWGLLNELRGKTGLGLGKTQNYVFAILFYKYLSEKQEQWLTETLRNDETWEAVYRQDSAGALDYAMSKLGYAIRPNEFYSDWMEAIKQGNHSNAIIQECLGHFATQIHKDAEATFTGLLDDLALTSTDLGATPMEQNYAIQVILETLNDPTFDLSDQDTVQDIYEYLLAKYSMELASTMGQYYTPRELSDVMSRIALFGKEQMKKLSLYDPTVGSASLLLSAAKITEDYGKTGAIKYFGQELEATPWKLARMNLLMHGVSFNDISIRHGNTLNSDWPDGTVNGKNSPRMFDAVIANPPYSAKWNNTDMGDDPRFRDYGLAPASKADLAFLLHGIYHLNDTGRLAMLIFPGAMYRGNKERTIRETLIKRQNIEAVIQLPSGLFMNTSIGVVLIIASKAHQSSDVLFVDASKGFAKVNKINQLRSEDIEMLVDTVVNKKELPHYSRLVSADEIAANDFNLSISTYVEQEDTSEKIDIDELETDIKITVDKITQLRSEIDAIVRELRK